MAELTNPQNTPEPDGATLTIDSNSDLGTLYSYSKTTAFTGTDEENAAEIMANGVGQGAVVGTNTRVVTGQDGMTDHYAGWVQDSDGYGGDMVMEFDVSSKSLTIPIGVGTYDAVVDWGDGETSTVTGIDPAAPTHTYAAEAADTAVVLISGTCPHISFNSSTEALKLLKVLNWGDIGGTSGNGMFRGAENCTEISSEVVNTSGYVRFDSMLRNLYAATYIDTRNFDTRLSTNFASFSQRCRGITSPLDFSSFNTTGISNFSNMCADWLSCLTPPDFSGFDMSSAENISSMCQLWESMGAVDIAIDQWQIPNVTSAANFLLNSKLTTACYDRTLASWGNQTLAAGALSTTIHFGTSQYTDQASKDLLLAQCAGIIDGGVAP